MLCSAPTTSTTHEISAGNPAPPMDALQLQSFSYRWLMSVADEYSAVAAASFIDIDPRLMSLRWTDRDAGEDFDFGNADPPTLAHADEIFSDGVVLPRPLAAAAPEEEGCCCDRFPSADSELSRSSSLDSTRVLLSLSTRHGPPTSGSVAPAAKPSRPADPASTKILRKYLCLLLPLLQKVKQMGAAVAARGGRRRSGKGGLDRRRRPSRATVAAVVDEEPEKSIHEAVLHCKKSIGA